ncbi:acyltransferase family protein [Enterococcus alishanensis]|uniref:Acyltransferase n=1 Tax=Enterococcus alishanensis TaxID=1303817 RepID=A0ABS6TDK9_9ENTE|nr:acyltransferase [Enterococcus alishanensis]
MKKKYLYEVDFMRNFFISGVLLNHITGIVKGLFDSGAIMYTVLGSLHASLHFTRMGFMFMTGLVLFLAYRNKDLQVFSFWRKRYVSVGIPYIFWNMVYSLFALPTETLQKVIGDFWGHLIHGDQAYLYYVLVTMQLYLIFPFLLLFLKRFRKHSKLIFAISYLLQLAMTFFIKYKIRDFDMSNWPYLLSHWGIFVGTYQLYFIAGGIASLNYDRFTAFVERHKRKINWLALLSIPVICAYYLWNYQVLGLSESNAKSVHQPLFVIYATIIVLFALNLGRRWAAYREKYPEKLFSRYISLAAQLSFGIYLTQYIGMTLMRTFLIPVLRDHKVFALPAIPLLFIFVFGLSFIISYLLYKSPLSSLIGRKHQKKLTGGRR